MSRFQCSRGLLLGEMYLYHVLTLSVVGPIPIKSHEVFVVYFDMIFVVSNLKLFVYSFSTVCC